MHEMTGQEPGVRSRDLEPEMTASDFVDMVEALGHSQAELQSHVDQLTEAHEREHRDWLAGLAMQGIVTCSGQHDGWDSVARMAYECADAMMRERGREPSAGVGGQGLGVGPEGGAFVVRAGGEPCL